MKVSTQLHYIQEGSPPFFRCPHLIIYYILTYPSYLKAVFSFCKRRSAHVTLIMTLTNSLAVILYNKPTGCNSGRIVFINNYKYALHVSDALCVHHQEHYNLQQQPLVFVMSWVGINPV